jgi:hypothetical protein
MLLVALLSVVGIALIALIDASALALRGSSTRTHRDIDQIALVATYVAPYCIFAIGLLAWLRARNAFAWVPRIVAVGVIFLNAVAPWVAAAVTGALTDSGGRAWTLIAAPSPFFLVSMLTGLGGYSHDASMLVSTGMFFALAWGLVGVGFLAVAKRRGDRIVAERDAMVARAQAAYQAEDRAISEAAAVTEAPLRPTGGPP